MILKYKNTMKALDNAKEGGRRFASEGVGQIDVALDFLDDNGVKLEGLTHKKKK